MLTIERGRTNVVPLTLLIACIVLFLLRGAVVYYATFFHSVPEKMIAWGQPKPIDKSRTDLLATPRLYFLCDTGDQWNKIFTDIYDSLLFQNREVAALINKTYIPIKVELKGEKSDALSKSIKSTLRATYCPGVYITLPNGAVVDSTTWQSDRMFVAFLKDALRRSSHTAAFEAMRKADWTVACRAFQLDYDAKSIDETVDLYGAIYWSFALRHKNQEEKARKVLEDALRRNKKALIFDKDDTWPEPCVHYLLGDLTHAELMKKAAAYKKKNRYQDETARFVYGVNLLLAGKTELAKTELKKVAENRDSAYYYSGKMARAELRALGENYPEQEEEEESTD